MEVTRDNSQHVYEHACHEGNEGLRGILSAARKEERGGGEVDGRSCGRRRYAAGGSFRTRRSSFYGTIELPLPKAPVWSPTIRSVA